MINFNFLHLIYEYKLFYTRTHREFQLFCLNIINVNSTIVCIFIQH